MFCIYVTCFCRRTDPSLKRNVSRNSALGSCNSNSASYSNLSNTTLDFVNRSLEYFCGLNPIHGVLASKIGSNLYLLTTSTAKEPPGLTHNAKFLNRLSRSLK